MRNDGFRDFILDQLDGLPGLDSRAMFGGHGFYLGDSFFAILWKGRLFFKTDERSRSDFVELGMKPFRPKPGTELSRYYEVPADIVEDRRRLHEWATRAASVVMPKKNKRKR